MGNLKEETIDKVEEIDNQNQSSYRQIFKATSIFGGVQVFNILIGIVRTKFVAVLLGATGVGIVGLLRSPLDLIMAISGLGIAFSAVRDVSKASATGDNYRIAESILTLKRWAVFTGLLGLIITVVLSPFLSEWSFGNKDYILPFVVLSTVLFIQAISKSQKAILQGTRRIKSLGKASIIGSVLGLFISVPLYYLFGIRGIVPSMISTALISLVLSWYFSRQVKVENIKLSLKHTFRSGLSMVKLGVYMTLAGFIASLTKYILNAYISNNGGIEIVGLYNAGWGVIGKYTGVVFVAMATDYFPRLSAVQSNNTKVRELVSQQSESAILILTPLLVLLIAAMPLVIRILYTPEFVPIVMFANITVLGILFKAISWAMGYVYLAKGNGRLFLTIEIISGAWMLFLNLMLYSLHGLNGLGISFIITYISTIALSFLILRRKYEFKFNSNFFKVFGICLVFLFLSFVTAMCENPFIRYSGGVLIVILASLFSLKKMNELIDLRSLIRSRFKINK